MGIDIYGVLPSPPCRAVFLVAKAIGLDYNLKTVAMEKGEHLKAEFLKLNPAHTVPTMVDGGLVLGESKAIITYIMNQYAPANQQSLYPRDPAARALVDQRLYFDSQLFGSLKGIVFPLVFLNDLKQSEAGHANVNNNLALLETFLTRSSYLAGENLTVADLATFANISTMECAGLDLTKYPHVNAWLQKLKEELTYAEAANGEGAKMLGGMYQTKLKELGGK